MGRHFFTQSQRWLVVRQVELQSAINDVEGVETPEARRHCKALKTKMLALEEVWLSHSQTFELDLEWLASKEGRRQHKLIKSDYLVVEIINVLAATPNQWISDSEIRKQLLDMRAKQFHTLSFERQVSALNRVLHRVLVTQKAHRRKSMRFANEYEWKSVT